MKNKPVVLGLGNDLLGDDAVGILAARSLDTTYPDCADIKESNLSGLTLLDLLAGYDKAIIVDAIHTGKHPPGTIIEMTPADLHSVPSASPHYASFAEVLSIARRLELDFPGEIVILAVEIGDTVQIGGRLSEPLLKALPDIVEKAKARLVNWN